MSDDMKEWVESAVQYATDKPFVLSDPQVRCLKVLCSIVSGPHNLHPIGGWGKVHWFQNGMAICSVKSLATYDGDELTRLVLAAHAQSVRFDISVTQVPLAWGMSGLDDEEEAMKWTIDSGQYDAGPVVGVLLFMLHYRFGSTEPGFRWKGHPTLADLAARCEWLGA